MVDSSKAERHLGHDPQVTLEEGLGRYIEWMRRIYGDEERRGGHDRLPGELQGEAGAGHRWRPGPSEPNLCKALIDLEAELVIILDNMDASYKWNIPSHPSRSLR